MTDDELDRQYEELKRQREECRKRRKEKDFEMQIVYNRKILYNNKEVTQMKKNIKYITLIFISVVGLALIVSTIWYKDKDLSTIIASIGSGIFCSSIVSMLVEFFNKKRDISNKLQIKYSVLDMLKNDLLYLLTQECKYLSYYLVIENQRKKSNIIKTSAREIIEKIIKNLSLINDTIQKEFQEHTNHINLEWLKNNQEKNETLYNYILPYYKRVKADINNFLSNQILLLTQNILSKDEIDFLKTCEIIIDDIIHYSESECREFLIEVKEDFYKEYIYNLLSFLRYNNERISTILYN